MAVRQSPKDGTGFNQAVKSFVGFAERIARREHIDAKEAESLLDEFATFIQPGNTSAFAGAVTLVLEMTKPEEPKVLAPLDVKPVEWKTHKDKKTGKATSYTATWEGFRLRVERVKNHEVVFIGFINDERVLEGKSRVRVRNEVESAALRMLNSKP